MVVLAFDCGGAGGGGGIGATNWVDDVAFGAVVCFLVPTDEALTFLLVIAWLSAAVVDGGGALLATTADAADETLAELVDRTGACGLSRDVGTGTGLCSTIGFFAF